MSRIRRRGSRSLSLRTQAWLLLSLPVVAVVLTQAAFQYAALRTSTLQREIAQLAALHSDTMHLYADVSAAESAVRGYLLTGSTDPDFLEPYADALRFVPALLGRMRDRQGVLPRPAAHVARLERLVSQRLETLKELRVSGVGSATSPAEVARLLGPGRRLSERIRAEIEQVDREHARISALAAQRLEGLRRTERALWIAMPVVLLASMALVGTISRKTLRRIDMLERNTVRLVEGEPLEPVPHGGGELDQLARALEQAAELLETRERERILAQREAERANQAKTAFLSRMSHELRTPLTAVLGFAELLEMDQLSADQRDSVRHIRKAGRHLLSLINEVLDIARIESGQLAVSIEPLELGPVVADAVTLIRPLAEERAIRLSGPCGDGIFLRADRQRLTQVLLNLLSNAVKYNRDAGEVSVRCERTDGLVRVSVSDKGMGIAPDLLPRVFAPFDRLGAEQTEIEGTGVGLVLSKGLVEVMGGQLTLTSVPGAGSTFTVTLAAADVPPPRALDAPAGVPAASAETIPVSVLYVEDNAANIDLVASLLRRRPGVHLITTMQGRLAMDLARLHKPDLVLLDLHLPDLDGEEVLRRLRQDPETARTLVAMLTADATPGQERRLRAMGADDYLTKPLDFARVIGLLDRATTGAAR